MESKFFRFKMKFKAESDGIDLSEHGIKSDDEFVMDYCCVDITQIECFSSDPSGVSLWMKSGESFVIDANIAFFEDFICSELGIVIKNYSENVVTIKRL